MTMFCSDKLPVTVSDVWSHMRDHAKPKTPLEAFYLMEARTYCEPSKAHRRRLLKLRPRFTKPPAPLPADTTARRYHNSAAQLGASVAEIAKRAALVERHYLHSSEPVRTPSVNLTRPPVKYGALKSETLPTLEQLNSRIAMLDADFRAERARLDAMKG